MKQRLLFLCGLCFVTGLLLLSLPPLPGLKHLSAYPNHRLDSPQNPTHIIPTVTSQDYFIGLALSGGGSRAAAFGASVMWELDRLGVLQHVQYISSVSGGSLPAAYYALFKDNPTKWNEANLRRVMSQSFETQLVWYAANPVRWPLYLGTGYDRTSALVEVFGNLVFERRTFADLPHPWPMLLVNATNYISGQRFVFSNAAFDNLRSSLSTLPVAVAVGASAAFPGVFRAVTLRNFADKGDPLWHDPFVRSGPGRLGRANDPRVRSLPGRLGDTGFVHLLDGGISDNLGIATLIDLYLADGNRFQRGCLLLLVDAHAPYVEYRTGAEPDPRRFYDAIVDTNTLNAVSVLMQSKRKDQLEALGFDDAHWYKGLFYRRATPGGTQYAPVEPENVVRPVNLLEGARFISDPFAPDQPAGKQRPACRVWHIALEDLTFYGPFPAMYRGDYEETYQSPSGKTFREFQGSIVSIPTRFKIGGEDDQNLHVAAQLLVREERTRRHVCHWLKQITGVDCRAP